MRKSSLIMLIIMAILIAMPVVALATPGNVVQSVNGGSDLQVSASSTPNVIASITDDVKKAQGSGVTDLQSSAETAGDSFVKFLRTIAIIVAVIMFIIVAYALLFSPNVKSIGDAKGRVGALVLAIAIAFLAEQIVGTLLSLFGYKSL